MSGNHQSGTEQIALNTIEEAIDAIRKGEVIIVVDDEDRENEGDFICAAEAITPETINFMATHGRGLICTPIEEDRANELELNMMVSNNTALHETAFTVSIDLIGYGCTTGISAYDRSTGIKALVNPDMKAADFARPGHIFPLRAKSGGVLRRTGHTEAAIDLAKLAGFAPVGVLVEILNEDGTMARLPDLVKTAEKFDLKLISIKDLVAYRMRTERIVKRELNLDLKTVHGDFEVIAYTQNPTNDTHLVIKKGEWDADEPVLVRIHSSTETDDIFGTLFKGYGTILNQSLELIQKEEKGLFLFMRHSENNDSILSRLRLLKDQQNGMNIPARNTGNGAASTAQRDIGVGAQILRDLGISKIKLITTNARRRVGLMGYGLEIVENVLLETDKK